MKILLLNTYDISGGASRAAFRLLKSLESLEVDVNYYVMRKVSDVSKIIGANEMNHKMLISASSVLDNFHQYVYKQGSQKFSSSIYSLIDSIKLIKKISPDIVHLHWINNGFFPINKLLKLDIPIVWSMHDNWVFTGGCHVKWNCERFMDKCGKCPMLHSKFDYDLSRINYLRKKRIFNKIDNITFIGLSKWLTQEANRSSLLKNKSVINLPNPINTDNYKQIDKVNIRKKYAINSSSKLICFGAMLTSSDANKGYQHLIDALQFIVQDSDFEFLIFGSGSDKIEYNFKNKIHRLGFISDEEKMIEIYNMADVVVVPSIQENLSNTIMESMACGTPVVAFNIGGNPDMIDHKLNGYLAEPYIAEDLAEGIKWVLKHPNYDEISSAARNKIVKEFDSKVVGQKYIELYKSILNK